MWQRSTFKRAAAVFIAIAGFAMGSGRAATFAVDPISVSLAKGNSSTAVAVTNQSPQKLRLQITGFAWQQKPSGEMQLTPTDDLVFFPQLLTLDPGETRRIRIGISTDQAATEKTYRVFMEELPSLQSVIAPKGASITIRMKVGIPVFLSPNVPAAIAGTVKDAAVRDGAISFDVVNTGNTHFAIQKVRVTGKDSAGGDVFSQELTGWYVLAGETRHFTVPVTKDRCAALASLAVAVRADALSFANSFSDLVKQCGPVSQR